MNPSLVRFPLRLGGVVAALWLCSFGGGRATPLSQADTAPPMTVQVTGSVVNLRVGPGLMHAVRGQVRQGTGLFVQGRSADDAWLAVAAPGDDDAGALWIYADLTDIGARRYALPWAGSTAVCARSPDVRAALLAALAAQDRARPCADVTWADLAALSALSPVADDRLWLWEPHDLAGLTGLRTAQIVVTDAYAAAGGGLSGLASLERLDLQSACCAGSPWPDHFLAGAPRLQDLTVEADYLRTLSEGFLGNAPQLQHLSLYARRLAVLPETFLAHTPQLQSLDLRLMSVSEPLPETFLAHAPQLATFNLYADHLAALPEGFLAHTPQLQSLNLRLSLDLAADRLAALPEGFLAHTPQLQSLDLAANRLATLPEGFLAHTPQLQSLDLAANRLATLPEGFLAHAPQLQSLDLAANRLATLPEGFLAHTPQLQSLNLRLSLDLAADRLAALPEGFLAHAPQLQSLDLAADRLAALPEGFLAHAPQLQSLDLAADRLAALPEGFLAHAPQLQSLDLAADRLAALPEGFLAHAPQLQSLDLAADRLAALPEGFLAHAPQLQSLYLNIQAGTVWPVRPRTDDACLSELFLFVNFWPAHFLQAHAPCLQQLTLLLGGHRNAPWPAAPLPDLPQLQKLTLGLTTPAWPLGLVAYAPQLRTLHLDLATADWPSLPRDFLVSTPQLQTLTLELPWPATRLPAHTLAEAPQLTQFRLQAPNLRELPRGFLAHSPRLRSLDMDAPEMYALPMGFLAHAPELETLALTTRRDGFLRNLPDGILANVPSLQRLTLSLSASSPGNDHSDSLAHAALSDDFPAAGFLAHAPRLQRLDLRLRLFADADGFTGLSDRFLAHVVSRLQHLVLDVSLEGYAQANVNTVTALPTGFLARAPHLQHLDLRLHMGRGARGGDIDRDKTTVQQHDGLLPADFLAHAPQLATFNLEGDLAALPDGFLAHAPRLTALDWYLPALTAVGDRVLARAPALVTFALDAPRLASVGEDFLARADRLHTLTLLTATPVPLRLGARFLAHAPQVHTVRIGAAGIPDAQTDLGAAALTVSDAFLADLPHLRTVELLTPLRDPPPPGFLRGTSLRALRLRVRIAAAAQGAPRLPARVQAAAWRLELTCDSVYPAAWLAPLAAAPPAALTVAPCHDEGQRWHSDPRHPRPPRLPPAALRAFLAGAPASTRLQIADYAQLEPASYAHLPVSALEFVSNELTFTGWVRAADAQRYGQGSDVTVSAPTDRARSVHAEPHARADVRGYLPPDPARRYPVLERTGAPETWLRISYDPIGAHLAAARGASALEALHLVGSVPPALAAFADRIRVPNLMFEIMSKHALNELKPLLRAPPASIRHVGAWTPLAVGRSLSLDGELAAALPTLDFACLHLVLPSLSTPLPIQLRAAARRHGIALHLMAGFAPDRLSIRALPRGWGWELSLDAADYFQQQHLPWAVARACPRSLLLIDASTPSAYPRVSHLPPDLLDRPGILQRMRIVFAPQRCPDCQADA